MRVLIGVEALPEIAGLQKLFLQTTWAKARTAIDIKAMLDGSSVMVSVKEKNKLIGFGRAITDLKYRALIDDIIVSEEYRESGIGKMIVKALLGQLLGVEEVFLNTRPEMEGYYRKFGFTSVNSITMKLNQCKN